MEQVEIIFESLKALAKKRKRVFETLYDQNRYGWEKWLQVELAFALKVSGTPKFEVPYEYDQRRLKPKSTSYFRKGLLDIEFRAANHLRDRPTAIEIKVNNTEKGFRGVLSDLIKIGAVRDSNRDWKFRCVTVVFVHGNYGTRKTKFTKIRDDLVNAGIARVHCTGNPGFEMIVLGWETHGTIRMTRDTYLEWLVRVVQIYSNHSVHPNITRNRDVR